MIHLEDYLIVPYGLYEAELNMEWWNSKSPAYQKRYLNRHPNSIYAKKVQSGELEVGGDTKEGKPEVKEEPKSLTPKSDAKEEKIKAQLESDKKEYEAINAKWKEALDAWRAIPDVHREWDRENQEWKFNSPEDKEQYYNKEEARQRVRSINAEMDVVKHRIDLAERRLGKLVRQRNFEARQATPNATDKYKESGIAQVVDFSGMDPQTEKEAVDAVVENIKRYPFMKNHLSFLGSHKSKKFQELSDQLAHDYYIDQVEKEYNKAKDTYNKAMEGYIGNEKVPSRAYDDEANWVNPDAREKLRWGSWSVDKAYEKIESIDNRGGPEGYIKMPVYQNAINRWKRMKSRNWAYYRPNSVKDNQEGLIAFNENKFDDANLQYNVDTKWHPEGCATKKATMDHEFGHAIWYKLGLNKNGTPNANGNDWAGRSPLQQFIAKEMNWGKDHIKNNLSEYGATNSSEFFAEAYSEYLNNPNPRPIAKKVGELLDQEIKARGY